MVLVHDSVIASFLVSDSVNIVKYNSKRLELMVEHS